jgi:aspartate/methionine/tyrosine aminotransferase
MPVLDAWLGRYGDAFRLVRPRAGAYAFSSYGWRVNSTKLIERLRDERGVLLVPGDQFGMDGFIRIGLGNELEYFQAGLDRLCPVFDELAEGAVDRHPERVARP